MSSGERGESGSGGGQSERLNRLSLASQIRVIKSKLVSTGNRLISSRKRTRATFLTGGDAYSQTGLPLFNTVLKLHVFFVLHPESPANKYKLSLRKHNYVEKWRIQLRIKQCSLGKKKKYFVVIHL